MATVIELRAALKAAGVMFSSQANKEELEDLVRTTPAQVGKSPQERTDPPYLTPGAPPVKEEVYAPIFGAFVMHEDGTYGRVWNETIDSYTYAPFGKLGLSDYFDGREMRVAFAGDLKPANEHCMNLMHMRYSTIQNFEKDRAAQHRSNNSAPKWSIDALV